VSEFVGVPVCRQASWGAPVIICWQGVVSVLGRREDLHTSSDALNVKDTIVLVSDMDSEPDGGTSDDDNASDNMIWPMKIPTRRRRFC
jgi:hypothetical protein